MTRLSQALRDLAAALEEVESSEWELVAPASEQGPAVVQGSRGPCARARAVRESPRARPSLVAGSSSCSTSSPGLSRAEPSSTSVPELATASQQSTAVASTWGRKSRHYVILFAPHDRTIEGHWFGQWILLEKLLPDGKFCGSRVQLKKVTSHEAAEAEWKKVWSDKPMPSRTLK